ncbi:MAG: hypothetical protein ABIP63_06635 [Thermoanaerobaculia bacterium]
MDLTQSLEPLTRRERAWYWGLLLFCGATRFLAMARSLWDWDEALFCLGMRSYDVTQHHPHPPGFPLYMGAAKLLRPLVGSDFRALQAVSLLAGVLLFPALFLLARELRLRVPTAAIAALLCAFFPNVWFFGGAAFSDVPSVVVVVFAVAFLFRGCRDANSYLIGSFLLAVASGIRPQNFLIGLFPGILATWIRARSSFRDVIFAALIGVATVGAAFGAAILVTGNYGGYLNAVREHAEYISRVDSFRSAGRPSLWRLLSRFFIKQYESPGLSLATSLLVVVSMVGAVRKRDRSMLYNALTFGPFAILAWLMLDRYSVSRFSIGYAPMFAMFAADGAARLAGGRQRVEVWIGGLLAASFFIWTLPALTVVREVVSPTVLAGQAVRAQVDPRRDQLFAARDMTPFIELLAPNLPFVGVLDERAMPMTIGSRRPMLVSEIAMTHPTGSVYRRQHDRLWNIARRHYFDVALQPLTALPQFVSGWYPGERAGRDEWRWMSAHSVTRLPPVSGPCVLHLLFSVPIELVPQHPIITIAMNGTVIDRFAASQEKNERDYDVTPAPGNANLLELSIDRTLNPAAIGVGTDARDLGLLVRFLSFGPG